MSFGNVGAHGKLQARRMHGPGQKPVHHLSVPKVGRFMFTRDPGSAFRLASEYYQTHLQAHHFDRHGRLIGEHHLGSGLVTNVGVNLMVNDPAWAAGATLKQMNYHAIGTGATAAAASDYYLQTAQGATNISGSTNGYMTGAWTLGGNSAPNAMKNVATFTFTGSVAVTEWVLAMSNAANFSGTATSTSTSSLTNTGATFTTGGNGLQGWSVEANTSAVNTPTTTAMGQVTSNTGTALTLLSGWLTLADAAASTPSGTTNYVVYPSIWDHKVFAAINVVNGDSIQFTYTLTVNSGG